MSKQLQNTQGENQRLRIVIIDDHLIVRTGLRVLLNRELDFVVESDVGSAAEALELITSDPPQLAIVDVLLENENGLDLIRAITALNLDVLILACSMYDERLYAERAIAAGAKGYINNRAGIEHIAEAIRLIRGGGLYLSESMQQFIHNRHSGNGASNSKGSHAALSNRELEIFRLSGHGLTTEEIGVQLQMSAALMDSHRTEICRKLQLDSTQDLIREAAQWVRGHG